MSIKKWLEKNTRELNGEVIAITGGTGGLGRECVKILSQLNAEIILLDRNLEKGNSLIKEIKKLNPLCKISQIPIDLGVVDSLKKGINQIKLLPRLDTLILNAGVFRAEGKNGEYREEFITNFVSSFYLANSVVPLLKKSRYAKIVCVGSIAYRLAKLNFDDLDYQKSGKQIDIYGNSKRLLMASLSWLSKLNKDINFCLVHPGVTPTNITRHFNKVIRGVIKLPMKVVFNSPKKSSLCIIKGLFDNTMPFEQWIGPKHFDVWGMPSKKSLKGITEDECQKAFNLAIEMCGNLI